MRAHLSECRIRQVRFLKQQDLTQDNLIARTQVEGIDISANILSCIELGKRYATNIVLVTLQKS